MKKLLFPILALILAFGLGLVTVAPVGASPGIVGLWHLDDNANDSSGNGNDGTVSGATYVDGMFDKALSFDGSSNYVQVAEDDTTLDLTEMTIEAWIKVAVAKNYNAIVIKGEDGAENYELLLTGSGLLYSTIKFTDGTRYYPSVPSAITDTNWHHVAMTYKPGEWRIYVDGVKMTERTDIFKTPLTNDIPLFIGAEQYLGSFKTERFFNGTIDEVRIWDEALSADDIAASASLRDIVISKELTALVYQGSVDPNLENPIVPMATEITFTMEITVVNGSIVELGNVEVKDPLPAELELVVYPPEEGCVNNVEVSTKGKSEKVFIEWDLGYVTDSSPCTLEIEAQTDLNPADHQEYTSTGTYELNGGAALSFCVTIAGEDICLDMNSGALWIEAVGEEEE